MSATKANYKLSVPNCTFDVCSLSLWVVECMDTGFKGMIVKFLNVHIKIHKWLSGTPIFKHEIL